jgi:hypothetical protein
MLGSDLQSTPSANEAEREEPPASSVVTGGQPQRVLLAEAFI